MPQIKTRKRTKKVTVSYKHVKSARKRVGLSMISRVPNVHRFKRVANFSNAANLTRTGIVTQSADALVVTLVAGTAIQYGAGAVFFTMDALPNSTEFSLLFDEYRIDKVQIKFTPFWTQSLTAAAASAVRGQTTIIWHDIFDKDDSNLPTASDAGINELRQYNGYRQRLFTNGRPIIRTLYPCVEGVGAIAAGVIGAVSNMTLPRKNYYDMAVPNVQYNAYKFVLEASDSGAALVLYMKCEVTTWITCRGVR